jgi:cytosine/adenosine deaminase-related metal-dependent hydrolase
MIKAIIHTTIYDEDRLIKDAYVVFDHKIIETGPMTDFKDQDYEIIDGSDQIVMPSFVCAHAHIYSTLSRGLSVPFSPSNFQEILDQLWWLLDRNLDLGMIEDSGIVQSIDYLKNGVTTLIDHHASGVIKGSLDALKKAVFERVGLRGAFAFETSDRFDVEEAIEENIAFHKNNQTKWTRGLFGMHASMSLSEDTLKRIKERIGDQPIHIHVAESEMDQDDAHEKYDERVVHRLNRHGLLNENSLIAHGIYVTDDELNIIKGKSCAIVANVTSNMNNGVGLPRIKAFLDKGIPVLIGNDGISSSMASEYAHIYYSMHHDYGTPNRFGLGDLRRMIDDTYDYTNRLFGIKIGRIEKNYDADIMLVPYIPPTPMDADNAFAHLFFGLFMNFRPKHVFIAGIERVKNYEVEHNLVHAYRKARQSAQKLWTKIDQEVKSRES